MNAPLDTEQLVAQNRVVEQSWLSRYGTTLGLPAAIVVVVVIGQLLNPKFLTGENILNIANSMSLVGIIAVGMTFVFVTRGMADLSVPATMAIGGLLVLILDDKIGTIPAGIVAVLVAAAFGLVNGLLIGYAGLNPVITTLAVGTIVLGISQIFAGGVIQYGQDPAAKAFLFTRIFGVLPMMVLIFLVVALLGHLLLSRTVYGRWTYAVGSNPQATEASAVPVKFVRAGAFVMTAALAGFAGVLYGVFTQASRPGIGAGYEFDAITAVVVGGVSLLGGSGSVLRAMLGLLFVSILSNILILQGVPTEPQGMVQGALIVGAVALDIWLRRRGGRE